MTSFRHGFILACMLCLPGLALGFLPRAAGADAPDGTAYTHSIISIDGPTVLHIRYCGLPIQVRLANVQTKGGESEKASLNYLKNTLHSGSTVKIEMEEGGASDAMPFVQVFFEGTHINLEMVKQGLAISDGRSNKYGPPMQAAQLKAMENKIGLWTGEKVSTPAPVPVPAQHAEVASTPIVDQAPPNYEGPVVADLSNKEYQYPESRFARSIRSEARIEYKSPDEAERAGKMPSPFSFPERSKRLIAKAAASAPPGDTREKIVEDSKKALSDALSFMQEARRLSKNNNARANENWKKAARLLALNLDRLTPVADSNPNDREVQKLAEEMSMNMYSCNKYQSL